MISTNVTPYSAYSSVTKSYTTASQSDDTETTPETVVAIGSESASYVSLSDEAKTALEQDSFSTFTENARAKLDELLEDAGLTSPYKNGVLAINLDEVDRRSLYAIASNSEDQFNAKEQKMAQNELSLRFDLALAGPAAVARVTYDFEDLYSAAEEYMDGASREEKASDSWQAQWSALAEASAAVSIEPGTLPGVENDPVSDYLIRVDTGEVGEQRPFADVADDVRVLLDNQKAAAAALGAYNNKADFSMLGSRSLAAVALNEGDQFSAAEVKAAKDDMRLRSGAAFVASLKSARESSDPTSLAKNILSAYSSLSVEEREAAGWSEDLYEMALSNYESSSKIAQMFGNISSDGSSGGNALSILNYL